MVSSATAVVSLPSDTQILITREFDAPAHLVYRAFTEADLIKRWWSGNRGEVTLAEIDLRVGGSWRYVMIANGGFEVAFHGDYLEIVPDHRVVSTEVFEAMPDKAATVTTTFAERAGRTVLEMLVQHATSEDRDAHLNSGMEGGMQEAMDKLEVLAASLGR